MSDPLGSLSRTHTCGALRPADVGADVVLLGWIHRVRDLGGLLFLDVRDRHGVTQVMVPNDSPVMADAKKLRSEYVVAVLRPGAAARCRDGEREARHRRGGSRRARDPAAERGEDAAVPDRRRHAGQRGRAAALSLSRSAPSAPAVQPGPAASRDDGDPEVFRRQWLLGDRDADPRQVHARRARATTWCRAACTRASSSRCRSRRSSSSRS